MLLAVAAPLVAPSGLALPPAAPVVFAVWDIVLAGLYRRGLTLPRPDRRRRTATWICCAAVLVVPLPLGAPLVLPNSFPRTAATSVRLFCSLCCKLNTDVQWIWDTSVYPQLYSIQSVS